MDEDYEYLLKLCRAGKLYEAEALLREGIDPNPPPGLRKSALAVAIEKGFHSLVVLLLQSGARPGQKDIWEAARAGTVEMLGLLIDHGGFPLDSRDVAAACERGGGPAIDLLASHGADLVKGSPLFEALCTGNKSVIGAWKRHLDRNPSLAAQGAMALAHFCRAGSERGVALMLWAGADPRMPVPPDGELEEEDPDRRTTALAEAAAGGKIAILKVLGIDPLTDHVPDLVCTADLYERREAMEFLLDLCTQNQRTAALARMLQSAIWSLGWKCDPRTGWWGQYPASSEVEKIERLARMGAKLCADREPGMPLRIRTALRRAEPDLALRVIRALASGPVSDIEQLRQMVRTKTIIDKLRYRNLSASDMELLGMKPPKEVARQARGRTSRVRFLARR